MWPLRHYDHINNSNYIGNIVKPIDVEAILFTMVLGAILAIGTIMIIQDLQPLWNANTAITAILVIKASKPNKAKPIYILQPI